ncbi:hypothetical protein ASPVEDRAFT_84463 [Aspergillus versicolor CBS 583.65]|uniref:Zn(2)-C6 fungal-type domain-containing protein n=1 Tax=Aspergillus versicolor CBS 583.65 TaxID=1036611 RepID=A0A1L9PN86_ASPVE|nr:uncharacterized protein ASPVEDRAFT_84463 [Aspergillus versicolor CBS 583.65]OJJ02997.1 hypothetical protein ASPVEDRAFT_84463 [Aspergillus versicolor CBS 583.65]
MESPGKRKQLAGTSRLNLNRSKLTRTREVQACQQCRSRKVRCDQCKPQCQTCIAHRRPCSYTGSAGALRSGKVSSKDTERELGHKISLNQNGLLKATVGTTPRYFASSSWIAAVEGCDVNGADFGPDEASSGYRQSPGATIGDFIHLPEVDHLISWYATNCHFWHPFVDIEEVTSSVQCIRNHGKSSSSRYALVAAICYSAVSSINVSGECKLLSSTALEWNATANHLLISAGYPISPDLDSLQAAFLLATPSTAEERSRFDPGPVCVLVRAAQSLGLHREPLSFQLSARNADIRRVLWWSIYALDVSYAMAHALPPLIYPATSDVRVLDGTHTLDRKLITTIHRVSVVMSRAFLEIYGASQPTYRQIQSLDAEAARICSEEVTDSHASATTALERFIATSRRMCCFKMIFVLHQPYLRANQWPTDARKKTLSACQGYIDEFVQAIQDMSLSPYRWVLRHFNMIHPCAIILQDLIQNPGSAELHDLRETVDKCFSALSTDSPPNWTSLQRLRDKAWAANQWHLDGEVDTLDWLDTGLLDWDPLFASFNWDDMLLFSGEFPFSLRMVASSDPSLSGHQTTATM